ncbi:MAG: SpoIIE family protein phosphatase [Lentisphaeria bacterium]|nr:SpoIIE family protein phosphatase [Lentisphaeria bacterium]
MEFREIIEIATSALGLLLISMAILIVFLYRRMKKMQRKLEIATAAKYEMDDFLTQFSEGLESRDGLHESVNTICSYVAQQIGAEGVAIYECCNGELTASGVAGIYPLIPSRNYKLLGNLKHLHEAVKLCKYTVGDGSFAGSIAEKKEAENVLNPPRDERFANTLSVEGLTGVLGEPLLCDDNLFGVIVAINNNRNYGASFSSAQKEHLHHLATQIVLMHQLVNSYSAMNRRARIDQELEFARQIQFSLLPKEFPDWAQFSITAFTKPAKEVNGDFYDFVQIDDDRLLIVIGDACGKGIPACMLSAMTRSFIRALADNFTTLSDFLIHLNNKVYADTDDGRYITLNCCLLDKKNSLLEFGRAGHTELITFVHNHLRVIYPEGAGLGILPSDFSNFDTFCLAFEQGMSFLVFSDGITEAVNSNSEEYGIERLKIAFQDSIQHGMESQKVIERILDEVQQFSGDQAQADDQTLILIQYK